MTPTFRTVLRVFLITAFIGCSTVNVVAAESTVEQPVKSEKTPLLKWDALEKRYQAPPGETTHTFLFQVTNTADHEVVITDVRPSCGCTMAELPENPWRLKPGGGGTIRATMDFIGKNGEITKFLDVLSSEGVQRLTISASVTLPPMETRLNVERQRNQEIARVDRQGIFRGTCAQCHAAPANGKEGEALYLAVCAICHEAKNRAAIVPDLHVLEHLKTSTELKRRISDGVPGTLMPGFSFANNGPLSETQINSLVSVLMEKYK